MSDYKEALMEGLAASVVILIMFAALFITFGLFFVPFYVAAHLGASMMSMFITIPFGGALALGWLVFILELAEKKFGPDRLDPPESHLGAERVSKGGRRDE